MPTTGEVFKTAEDCLWRLNMYGFAAGCLFVTFRSVKGVSATYKCSHHSDTTANKRGLDPRVLRATDSGKVISNRQRD